MHIFMIRNYAGSKVRPIINTLPETEVDTVVKISTRLKIQYGIEGNKRSIANYLVLKSRMQVKHSCNTRNV